MTIIKRIKPREKRILFPDSWYDKELPYIVSGFGSKIPINRIVALFALEDAILIGSPANSIFYLEHEEDADLEPEGQIKEVIEEYKLTREKEIWWKIQYPYEEVSYDAGNRLKERKGWSSDINSYQSKNHHIWYLMWFDPLKLENIEPGGNDQIWGDIGEVDYDDLWSF